METQAFLRNCIRLQARRPRRRYDWAMVEKASGQFIGICGFSVTSAKNREGGELGYCLNRKAWGKGYATEATRAMIQIGFKKLGLRRITATCDAKNRASARVLEKAGMRKEGRFRKNLFQKGKWRDTFFFGILKEDWKGKMEAVQKNEMIAETKVFQGFRKMYHVLASSLFPLAYLYPPFHLSVPEIRRWLLIVAGFCFLISFTLDLMRLRDHKFNSWFMGLFSEFIRRTEANRFNGSTFLCMAFFLVVFFFSRNIAITAMFFLSLGDAAAELGGKNFGRIRMFGKSLEGTAAFFLVAFLVAFALFDNWLIALVGAFAGALVELLSFEWDDNLTVPIGSALVLSAVFLLLHLGSPLTSF